MKRSAGFAVAASVATAAALVSAPAAGALVHIDRGIAGVRLDNTRAQVRAALGTPITMRFGRNDFGRFAEYRYRGGIRVLFQGGEKVSMVSTTGLGDRTIRGVGVGSRESDVARLVPGARCEVIAGTRSCHTGSFTAGQRLTDFLVRHGRVTRITVGFVFD
jgi:hypothetical protein